MPCLYCGGGGAVGEQRWVSRIARVRVLGCNNNGCWLLVGRVSNRRGARLSQPATKKSRPQRLVAASKRTTIEGTLLACAFLCTHSQSVRAPSNINTRQPKAIASGCPPSSFNKTA